MKKTLFLFLSIFSFLLGAAMFISPQGVSYADDEEEEEEEEDEEDEDEEDEKEDKKSNKSDGIKEVSAPRSVPITTTTLKSTTTILKDSDGDGLYDNEDPHPTIPELYIVQDENRNGIADHLEILPSP